MMSKINVVYWSGTGNTEAMAEAVGAGIAAAGKEANVIAVSHADTTIIMEITLVLSSVMLITL